MKYGKVIMVNPSVGRMVTQHGGTIGGYRVASTPEVGNGLIDGLILLIAAIANQAIDEGCECDGCQRWIQLYKDWGMEGTVPETPRKQGRRRNPYNT